MSQVNLDKLVEVTYDVTKVLYYQYTWSRYSLEDFQQDAAMHIISLYKRDYFVDLISDSNGGNVAGLIYTLLKLFASHRVRDDVNTVYRNTLVDATEMDMYGDTTGFKTPEDIYIDGISLADGKKIYEKVLGNFPRAKFRTKHTYKYGNDTLSYYIVAKLILDGWYTRDITNAFADGEVGSAKRQFVQAKIRDVVTRLTEVIGSLKTDERANLKLFLAK